MSWPVAASRTFTLIVARLNTFSVVDQVCEAARCCWACAGALSGCVTHGSGRPTVSRYLYLGSVADRALGSRPANTTLPSAPVLRVWVGEVLRSAVTGAFATGWSVRASMTVAMIVDLPAIAPIAGGATRVVSCMARALPVPGVTETVTRL